MSSEKITVSVLSVAAALFLTIIKLVVGYETNSLGILSEALHSGLDVVAAVITLAAVHISDKPADREHHYGHGKVENFSALIEAVLLLLTCSWIIYEAIYRLTHPAIHVEVTIWSYAVVLLAIGVDITRSISLRRVAKKYNSQALEADALHFSSDILSSGVVLAGLIGAELGWFVTDSIAGLLVAIIVIVISFQLAKRAVDSLLDKAPREVEMQIKEVLKHNHDITGYHDLQVRSSGGDVFVDVCIHVPPEESILVAHNTADSLEKEISESVRFKVHTTIHIEPEGHNIIK
ncbi:cation diffusion facilitator family transporter [Microbacter margulisiae]|uniref:Cation diffusion facilitator family transporter n=1 Tax=Microbacter margulisiae TaxID=1350067 RepID=A0A7W5DQA4_9PORP|nr:cation diffusion facilitator family transporter [Microbacter margulisiae]MBB3186343.1 cation diffusion facilitator family transporter [Microbacter margulisiae]